MDPDHIDVWALRAHREGHRFRPTLRRGSPDVGKGGWQRLGVGDGSCAMRAAETVSGEADDGLFTDAVVDENLVAFGHRLEEVPVNSIAGI